MSDADDQMGGTGGERGPRPRDVDPGRDHAAPVPDDKSKKQDDQAHDESAQSFPASDPPANY
jgi:hypothetical protein